MENHNQINDPNESIVNKLNNENEQLNTQINILKEELNNLNFQFSSISIQRSTTTDVREKILIIINIFNAQQLQM